MEVPPPFAGHVEFVIHRRWVGSQCMHALLQCGLHLLRRFRDTGVLVAVTADSRGMALSAPPLCLHAAALMRPSSASAGRWETSAK